MTNDQGRNQGDRQAQPGEFQWSLGFGREQVNDVVWQCDALRAGKLYSRTLFATRAEAEAFASKLQRVEPDQMFNVEAIKASSVWN